MAKTDAAGAHLTDVLDLDVDEIDINPLLERAASEDVEVGVFTDEELHWMSVDVDDEPDSFINAPRLGQLPVEQQDVALQTAYWMLLAQGGIVHHEPDGTALTGVYAVLSEARTECEAAVSVRVDARGEGTSRAALYRIRPELYLCEEVDEGSGLHYFVFWSAARQAVWLAAYIDRQEAADRTDEPQTAETLDDLEPHPEVLAESSATVGVVSVAERKEQGRNLRVFTAFSGHDGLHVQTGWESDEAAMVAMQRLSPGDFVSFCGAFLARQVDG